FRNLLEDDEWFMNQVMMKMNYR
ncbi:hypothetical protein BVRB_034850, partial [Beta vulgaris subsp. vulgaris]